VTESLLELIQSTPTLQSHPLLASLPKVEANDWKEIALLKKQKKFTEAGRILVKINAMIIDSFSSRSSSPSFLLSLCFSFLIPPHLFFEAALIGSQKWSMVDDLLKEARTSEDADYKIFVLYLLNALVAKLHDSGNAS
jgi:hypothetical protein